LNGFASTSFKIKTHDLKSSQEADIKAISLFIKTALKLCVLLVIEFPKLDNKYLKE
jgi:hypothetical protein